jgi:hypothetical protein
LVANVAALRRTVALRNLLVCALHDRRGDYLNLTDRQTSEKLCEPQKKAHDVNIAKKAASSAVTKG